MMKTVKTGVANEINNFESEYVTLPLPEKVHAKVINDGTVNHTTSSEDEIPKNASATATNVSSQLRRSHK